jgi:signal transduction histidine kinase
VRSCWRLFPIAVLVLAGVWGCAQVSADSGATSSSGRIITLQEADFTARFADGARDSGRVSLPLIWDSSYPGRSGTAMLTFTFGQPPGAGSDAEPWMLLLSRIGNAYVVTLNGVILARAGDLNGKFPAWSSKRPVGISIPSKLLASENVLSIQLRADSRRKAGLSPPLLGPAQLVNAMRERAYELRVVVPQICSAMSLLVAGLSLLLWLQQREPLFAWASVGEAIWSFVMFDLVWESPPLRWQLWYLVAFSLRMIWVWSLYAIVTHVFGERPRLERLVMKWLVIAAVPALLLSAIVHSALPSHIWFAALILLFVFMVLQLLVALRRNRTSEQALLLLAIAMLLVTGAIELVTGQLLAIRYDGLPISSYSGSLLALTILWVVIKRYRLARVRALLLQESLEVRIEQKERELRETFDHLSVVERARAATVERERILRDMHDGVGANLATAMRQLESGNARVEDVAATLRESLDHLKLSIDAMTLPPGDVNAVLAALRYRLQPRMESAGLGLLWEVESLPAWPKGDEQAMRHLQFMLMEAISNVLQHAHASELRLSARSEEGSIVIRLQDNGRGMSGNPGRGLRSLQKRAALIDAVLDIDSGAAGTTVQIRLAAVA